MLQLPVETSRLILRSFADRDCEEFSRYRSDPEVARYQGWEAPFSLEQAVEFVNWAKSASPGQPGQWYQIAIELKTRGELIGDCAFQRLAEDPSQAEIGFTLAAEFQGQGYASEAVGRLVDLLFQELALHRIRANCDPANTASQRLLERLGFRQEGHFVESLWFKDGWADEVWYAFLEREWLEKHK